MKIFVYILPLLLLYYGVEGSVNEEVPSSTNQNVAAAFIDAGISPRYVPVAPRQYLNVVYGENAVVNLGNGLSPEQCLFAPCVTWNAEPNLYYTFIMFDPDVFFPDAIELPNTYLHWGRYNVKGGDMSTGSDFAPYLPITPPPISDPHRYVEVVYQQPSLLDISPEELLNITAQRTTFQNQQFVIKHNLGDAMFGNYFLGKIYITRDRTAEVVHVRDNVEDTVIL